MKMKCNNFLCRGYAKYESMQCMFKGSPKSVSACPARKRYNRIDRAVNEDFLAGYVLSHTYVQWVREENKK